MKMELMQPFINSLDAVIAETMGCSAEIADVTMEEGNYKRTGIAALVGISGEIEGRVILDMEMAAAQQATADIAGAEGSLSEETARETVCELTKSIRPKFMRWTPDCKGRPTRKRSCCGLRHRKALST